MHVRDAVLALEDPGALELDVLGAQVVEQTAALAEQHRDEMDLDLIEDAGGEPVVQALPAVAEPLSTRSFGPAMNPSTDMDM